VSLASRVAAHRRAALIAAAALLVLTALLGAYASRHGPLPGERPLFDHPLLVPFAARQAADAEQVLVGLGSPVVAVVLVLMLAAILFEAGERTGALLVVLASAVTAVCAAIKPLFGRHPLQHLAPVAHYPSGHVAFVTAVFGMTGLLAAARGRPVLAGCCAIPILGVGPAVLIGGGHVASDVLGGYLLAAAWVLVILVGAGQGRRRYVP
jgi:membrane-associated phospholipid phosphatase